MRTRGRGGRVEGEILVADVDAEVGIETGSEGKGIEAGEDGKGMKLGESELPCAETDTLVSERVQVGAAF